MKIAGPVRGSSVIPHRQCGDAGSVQCIPLTEYSSQAILPQMTWDVEYTDEFADWWGGLSEDEQEALDSSVRSLSTTRI